jgi:hypothetical protein
MIIWIVNRRPAVKQELTNSVLQNSNFESVHGGYLRYKPVSPERLKNTKVQLPIDGRVANTGSLFHTFKKMIF